MQDINETTLRPKPDFYQRVWLIFFHIQRYLFGWWLRRPAIVGREQLPDLKNKIICYVLKDFSRLEIVLLEKACIELGLPRPTAGIYTEHFCERFAFATLDSSSRAVTSKGSGRLLKLQQQLEKSKQLDILLLPVVIYWNRAINKEGSLWNSKFLNRLETGGYWHRLRALLFNKRHITLQYSQPVSMRSIISPDLESNKISRKIHRLLRTHFRRQQIILIGPKVPRKHDSVRRILASEPVQKLIQEMAKERNEDTATLEQEAKGLALEIVADLSYSTLIFMDYFLNWVWNRIYDGIKSYGLEAVTKAAQTDEIIYLPLHRSYMDFVLLSYVLFHHGIQPPHVASGENLNIFFVGNILRHCGAFFMRRFFKNALYAMVFQEYLNLLLTEGHSLEFFVEGGRSRTGYTLTPRRGMLSMTLKSYLRSNTDKRISLVPVYFGYEKIMEEGPYLRELRGEKKQKESFPGFISTMWKRLRINYGEVHVNFAKPIPLDEFLESENPNWRDNKELLLQPSKLSNIADNLSTAVTTKINQAVTVLGINLITCCLSASRHKAISEHGLHRQLRLIMDVLRKVPVSDFMITPETDAKKIIARAESLKLIVRTVGESGDTLACNNDLTPFMAWYRNNILHTVILPSLVSIIWRQLPSASQATVSHSCQLLYPYLQQEYHLPWESEDLSSALNQCHLVLAEADILKNSENGELEPIDARSMDEKGLESLEFFSSMATETINRYFVVLAVIKQKQNTATNLNILVSHSIRLIRESAPANDLNASIFFNTDPIRQFARKLTANGIIEINKDGELLCGAGLKELAELLDQLTEPNFRASVMNGMPDTTNLLPKTADLS